MLLLTYTLLLFKKLVFKEGDNNLSIISSQRTEEIGKVYMNQTNDLVFFEIVNATSRRKLPYDAKTKKYIKITNEHYHVNYTNGINETSDGKIEFRDCTEKDFAWSEEAK